MEIIHFQNKNSVENIHKRIIPFKGSSLVERIKRPLLFLMPIVFLLVGFYLFIQSDLLLIKKFVVKSENGEELQYLDVESISEHLGDLYKDKTLTEVNITEIQSEILKFSPFVKEVYVEKSFPNKIEVRVVERVPEILLLTERECAALDPENIVVELIQITEVDECTQLGTKYKLVTFVSTEIKADFEVGKELTSYESEKMILTKRVVQSKGYVISKIELKEGLYTISLEGEKQIIMSSLQEVEIQLKKFILVVQQIEIDSIQFKTLDLRYERPVITE